MANIVVDIYSDIIIEALLVNSLLDVNLLNDYKENLGANFVEQMFDLYVSQSEIYLTELKEAMTTNNHSLWHEQCHKMKGSAGSAGLIEIRQFLVSIERSTESIDIKQAHYKKLEQLNTQAKEAFNCWNNS